MWLCTIACMDHRSAPKTEAKAPQLPPGGRLQYVINAASSMLVDGTRTKQKNVFAKDVFCHLGSSYHTNVCPSVHLSGKFGFS